MATLTYDVPDFQPPKVSWQELRDGDLFKDAGMTNNFVYMKISPTTYLVFSLGKGGRISVGEYPYASKPGERHVLVKCLPGTKITLEQT
jgi:hypothetical protein